MTKITLQIHQLTPTGRLDRLALIRHGESAAMVTSRSRVASASDGNAAHIAPSFQTVVTVDPFGSPPSEARHLFVLPKFLSSIPYWTTRIDSRGTWQIIFTQFGGFLHRLAWWSHEQPSHTMIRVGGNFILPSFARGVTDDDRAKFVAISIAGDLSAHFFFQQSGAEWRSIEVLSGARDARLVHGSTHSWIVYKKIAWGPVNCLGEMQGVLFVAQVGVDLAIKAATSIPCGQIYEFDASPGPDSSIIIFAVMATKAVLLRFDCRSSRTDTLESIHQTEARPFVRPSVCVGNRDIYIALLESPKDTPALLASTLSL